jgi:hypothetical protein
MNNRLFSLLKKDLLRIILWVILAIVMLGFFRNTLHKGMNEFRVVHRAAARILHQENLYNFDDGHYLYKYSPFFAVLVSPLGLFSFNAGQVIWLLGMCLCLTFILIQCKKMILGAKPPPPYLYVLTILFASKFLVREITLGQTDFLILLFIFLFISFNDRKKDELAGLFLSLAVIIKPTSLVFVPYLLYKKKFKPVVYLGIFCILFLLAPSIIYGFPGNLNLLHGWKTVMSASSPPLLAVDMNQSVFAFFYRLLTPVPYNVNILNLDYTLVNLLIYATILVLFLFLLFLNRRSGSSHGNIVYHGEGIEYALLLIFMALFSPLGWFQNYSSSVLAIMILVNYVFETGLRDRFVIVMLILFFVLVDLINFEMVGRRLNDLSLYLSFITLGIFILIACLSKLRLSRAA